MKKHGSVLGKILNIFLTVILILLVVLIAFIMFMRISGKTPNIAGYMVFRVSTGSMEPDLMVGDVILSKSVDNPEDLKIGDVVTYQGIVGNYKDKLITHEIVQEPYYDNGTCYVVTQGIANYESDPPVSTENIVGIMVTKIPFINNIYNFFITPGGLLTAILLILLAFSGEFYNIYKMSRQKEDADLLSSKEIKAAVNNYKNQNGTVNNDSDLNNNDAISDSTSKDE
ncbi:MAG: signal peptidase I [bacterium]|nr:signal peptidase I [bacterium]